MKSYSDVHCNESRIGERHGDWLRIGPSFLLRGGGPKRHRAVVCECLRCEQIWIVKESHLDTGATSKCRICSRRENSTTHGYYHSAECRIWRGMHARCRDANQKNYGGRGIRVCERWTGKNGFAAFLADMGRRPTPEHEIDRIDNDGNYEPGNCRWATPYVQSRNRRTNKFVTFDGLTLCLKDHAKRAGLAYTVVAARLKAGWSVDRALTAPVNKTKRNRKALV